MGFDVDRGRRAQPRVPPERIEAVMMAATAQVGDQGLASHVALARVSQTDPGFAL